jgi:hypothetical protein
MRNDRRRWWWWWWWWWWRRWVRVKILYFEVSLKREDVANAP